MRRNEGTKGTVDVPVKTNLAMDDTPSTDMWGGVNRGLFNVICVDLALSLGLVLTIANRLTFVFNDGKVEGMSWIEVDWCNSGPYRYRL